MLILDSLGLLWLFLVDGILDAVEYLAVKDLGVLVCVLILAGVDVNEVVVFSWLGIVPAFEDVFSALSSFYAVALSVIEFQILISA